MYLSRYHLYEKPFQKDSDSKFIWFGEKYTEALAILKYGLQENKGFLLLTGDKGTGKTEMIDTFLKSIDNKVIAVTISNPVCNYTDFVKILSHEFKMSRKFTGKGEFLIYFKKFLRETYLQNKKILLIIDEVQKLPNDLLEEIRLLSNTELEYTELVNIFFVGRNEFNSILTRDSNKALRQRIGIRYNIDPLNGLETHKYIDHRLNAAGSDKKIFSHGAIKKIHLFSAGSPEMINTICDRALEKGHSLGMVRIDKKFIENCVKELEQSNILEINEYKRRDHAERDEQPPSLKNNGLPWRRLNLAASLFGLILIGIFLLNNAYLNQSMPKTTAENAYKNFKRYEERINRVKKDQSLNVIAPTADISHKKKIQRRRSEQVNNEIASPQIFKFFFQNNSNKLSKNNFETLERLVNSIESLPNCVVIIEGYTDSTGNYWHNKKLSKARADIVKNYFTKNGIDGFRIQTFGMGSEKPIASNQTEEGRKMNRRVEIKIIVAPQEVILSQR